MKYKAFTLAEVLITLGIIGVVAAMTIPTLMAKIQENTYKSQYKKIFSELNQALKLLEDDETSPITVCAAMDDKCFRDQFVKKIKISHICDDKIPNKCQKTSYFLDNSTLNNKLKINTNHNWPAFIALRGYSVKFRFHYKECATTDEYYGKYYNDLSTCGWVQVDVNGLSGPNTVGKDIFFLDMLQNGFVPIFINDDKIHDCYKGTGISCSSLYINNNGIGK